MPEMKKPTITPQDAVRVIAQIIQLCDSVFTHCPPKSIAPPKHNPFELFEEEFAHSKLTMTEMAVRCNMSLSAFKRKFTDYYGLPPHQWQIKHRLNCAAEMLLDTDLLVKQIAYECGFATPSHLIRCFKREFGCTPEEYRHQYFEKEQVAHRIK